MSKKPADAPKATEADHAPTDAAPPAEPTAPATPPEAAKPPEPPAPAAVPPPVAKAALKKPAGPVRTRSLLLGAEELLEDIERVIAAGGESSDHLPVARDRMREIVQHLRQRNAYLGTRLQA